MAVAEPAIGWQRNAPPRVRRRLKDTAVGRVSNTDRAAILGLVAITVVCIAAPWIAPHSTTVPVGQPFIPPHHGGFVMGTDEVGRDVYSRVLFGMRSSWFSALIVIASGVVIGGIIGLLAGTFGGWIDSVLMRVTDLFLALPGPILAIAVVAALGPSLQHTLIAVAIVWWPFYARIVRGEIRALASRPHVEAARLAGSSRIRVMRRHLLPGAVPATIVTASLDVGNLVLTLAALSFLGLGAPAPAPELGAMAARGLPYLLEEWWIPVMPGLALFVLALVANLAGDGLRDLIGGSLMDSGALFKLIVLRFFAMIGILIVLAAIVFGLERFTPADPVHVMVGANASPATIAAARHQLGYDKPLPQQFVQYLSDLAHGNMQMSLRTRRPVTTDLADYIPATLELAIAGMFLAGVIGVALGLGTALRVRGSGFARLILLGLASAPPFLLALVGILFFYRRLGWLPATGRTSVLNAPTGPTKLLVVDGILHWRWDVVVDAMKHLVLPALCVAFVPACSIARVLRSSLVSTMKSDHVRTARAKGLRESTVVRSHALRNSAGPATSMAGLQVGLMFAGVIVVEEVFAWPGIGMYTAQSIPRTDFPAIAGVTLLLGALYVVVNTIVDICQAIADPRIAF